MVAQTAVIADKRAMSPGAGRVERGRFTDPLSRTRWVRHGLPGPPYGPRRGVDGRPRGRAVSAGRERRSAR